MKAKTIAFILLAVILTLFTTPVYAQGDIPPLPHAFYGAVDVNGSPALVGTQVEVRGEGVQTGVGNNPIEITVEGKYGSSDPLEPKLIVQGDVAEGTTLTFYVNGVAIGQTAEWHSGGVTELNLAATIEGSLPEPPPPSEGITEPPPETVELPPETTESTPPESTPEPAPPAPPPAPTAPAEPVNWPVLWGVTGGMIVVGLIIFLLARRKAY